MLGEEGGAGRRCLLLCAILALWFWKNEVRAERKLAGRPPLPRVPVKVARIQSSWHEVFAGVIEVKAHTADSEQLEVVRRPDEIPMKGRKATTQEYSHRPKPTPEVRERPDVRPLLSEHVCTSTSYQGVEALAEGVGSGLAEAHGLVAMENAKPL